MKGWFVMFGYVKGYTIVNVSRKKLEKEDFTNLADPEMLRDSARAALESKGRVFLFRNAQKQCVCLYILQKMKKYTAPEGLEASANGKTVLVMKHQAIAEAHAGLQEAFDNVVLQEFKELVLYTDINAVQWNDRLITEKNVEHEVWENWYIWLPLAMLWGIVLDNWAAGFFMGLCCAGTSGVLYFVKKYKDNAGKKD